MTEPLHPAQPFDRARLDAVVDPIVHAHGGDVVDVEWKHEQQGWVLRVYVEKSEKSAESPLAPTPAPVSLDLCADVARDLSPALDVADLIPHRYHLEVSSPGLERPLKTARDFARFAGQKAKLRLKQPVDGQKVLVGVLEPATDEGVVAVREGSRVRTVPLGDVESARLVFEFGPAAKPGKPGKGHGGKATRSGKRTKNAATTAENEETRAPSRETRGESDSR